MTATTSFQVRSSFAKHPWELVDESRYPIRDLSSPEAKALIARCKSDLKASGACVLPGFLLAKATEALADEAEQLTPVMFHNTVTGNAYLEPVEASLPSDHPKRQTESTALAVIAYDQIPPQAGLRRLFEWEGLMRFVEAVISRGTLYRYADPMGALNIAVMGDKDYLRWHFDQTDFVTSIALQAPEGGGLYEYVPNIRSRTDENYDRVKNLLAGAREGVVTLPTVPGSFILFEGRNSIHRVTPIKGRRYRHMALLAYDTKPDTVSTDHLRMMRYGRAR